jgi:hypothetical protein
MKTKATKRKLTHTKTNKQKDCWRTRLRKWGKILEGVADCASGARQLWEVLIWPVIILIWPVIIEPLVRLLVA